MSANVKDIIINIKGNIEGLKGSIKEAGNFIKTFLTDTEKVFRSKTYIPIKGKGRITGVTLRGEVGRFKRLALFSRKTAEFAKKARDWQKEHLGTRDVPFLRRISSIGRQLTWFGFRLVIIGRIMSRYLTKPLRNAISLFQNWQRTIKQIGTGMGMLAAQGMLTAEGQNMMINAMSALPRVGMMVQGVFAQLSALTANIGADILPMMTKALLDLIKALYEVWQVNSGRVVKILKDMIDSVLPKFIDLIKEVGPLIMTSIVKGFKFAIPLILKIFKVMRPFLPMMAKFAGIMMALSPLLVAVGFGFYFISVPIQAVIGLIGGLVSILGTLSGGLGILALLATVIVGFAIMSSILKRSGLGDELRGLEGLDLEMASFADEMKKELDLIDWDEVWSSLESYSVNLGGKIFEWAIEGIDEIDWGKLTEKIFEDMWKVIPAWDIPIIENKLAKLREQYRNVTRELNKSNIPETKRVTLLKTQEAILKDIQKLFDEYDIEVTARAWANMDRFFHPLAYSGGFLEDWSDAIKEWASNIYDNIVTWAKEGNNAPMEDLLDDIDWGETQAPMQDWASDFFPNMIAWSYGDKENPLKDWLSDINWDKVWSGLKDYVKGIWNKIKKWTGGEDTGVDEIVDETSELEDVLDEMQSGIGGTVDVSDLIYKEELKKKLARLREELKKLDEEMNTCQGNFDDLMQIQEDWIRIQNEIDRITKILYGSSIGDDIKRNMIAAAEGYKIATESAKEFSSGIDVSTGGARPRPSQNITITIDMGGVNLASNMDLDETIDEISRKLADKIEGLVVVG